jgi:hypothetical protein
MTVHDFLTVLAQKAKPLDNISSKGLKIKALQIFQNFMGFIKVSRRLWVYGRNVILYQNGPFQIFTES